MNHINKAILLILFFIAISFTQASEQRDKNHFLGIETNFTFPSGQANDLYLNLEISLNQMNRSDSITKSILFRSDNEFNIFGPTPSERFTSLNFQLGKNYFYKFSSYQYYIALGYGLGVKRGSQIATGGWFSSGTYESIDVHGFNLVLGSTMVFKPFNFIGLGLNLKLVINPIVQGISFGTTWQLGQLR